VSGGDLLDQLGRGQRVDIKAVRRTNAVHRPHAVVIENMLDELAELRDKVAVCDVEHEPLLESWKREESYHEERDLARTALAKTRNELSNARAELRLARKREESARRVREFEDQNRA